MPRTESVKKAMRGSAKKRLVNIKRKTDLKSVIKNYKNLVAAGKKEEAVKLLPQVYKKLDKTAKVQTIKRNKASRLKSRLSKLVK